MTARLYTPRGFVVAVEIPPFETGYPPLVMWGGRIFTRVGSSDSRDYLETFCYEATVEVLDVPEIRRVRLQ